MLVNRAPLHRHAVPSELIRAPERRSELLYHHFRRYSLNGRGADVQLIGQLEDPRPRLASECSSNGILRLLIDSRPPELYSLAFGSSETRPDALLDHCTLKFGKDAHHLKMPLPIAAEIDGRRPSSRGRQSPPSSRRVDQVDASDIAIAVEHVVVFVLPLTAFA